MLLRPGSSCAAQGPPHPEQLLAASGPGSTASVWEAGGRNGRQRARPLCKVTPWFQAPVPAGTQPFLGPEAQRPPCTGVSSCPWDGP